MSKLMVIVQQLYGGGAERVAVNLSEHLGKSNDVLLVSFNRSKKDGMLCNARHICIDQQSDAWYKKPLIIFKRIRAIRNIKAENQIECAISFLENANLVNVFSKGQEKTIVSVRNNLSKTTNVISRKIESIIFRKADRVVSLSDGVRNDIIENFDLDEQKVTTIYNMCDTSTLFLNDTSEVSAHTEQLMSKKKCIISAGSLRYQKGQWHLIKAFKIINAEEPETLLVIFGEGTYREKLEKLVKALGLEGKVLLLGYIANYHYLMKKYGAVFCFSSIYEGFGNVILEAMAAGIPVVSTNCNYGPAEIMCVDDVKKEGMTLSKYGVLAPPFPFDSADFSSSISNEEREFAECVKYLLKNEDACKDIIENGYKRLKDFSPERIVKEWERIL